MAMDFALDLDDHLTGGMIRRVAQATEGIKIVWCSGRPYTAGQARSHRTFVCRNIGPGRIAFAWKPVAQIELSTCLITNKGMSNKQMLSRESSHADSRMLERLYNAVAHEFCHLVHDLVTFHHDTGDSHGPAWTQLASAVMTAFSHLDLEIASHHTYPAPHFRHEWRCTNPACHIEMCRQTMSLDATRDRCSTCGSSITWIR